MNEEKHVLTKLENIYFGKKENEKLTMHEIGVVLDYVALLEQKGKQLQQKENIIKEVRKMLYKRDKDNYDTYTANVLCDIQSDFEEILRGEY